MGQRLLYAVRRSGWLSTALMAVLVVSCDSGHDTPTPLPTSDGISGVTITPAATTLTIHPGDQNVTLGVQVTASSYGGPIVVTASNLPSGITFTPLTLTSGGSGTLSFNASVSAGQELFTANLNSSLDEPTRLGTYELPATIQLVAAAGGTQTTVAVTLTVSLSNPAFAPASSNINLPVVTINTGGVAITSTVTDVSGTFTVTSADQSVTYESDSSSTFHVHGNSTALMPKLPYKVKLSTSVDLLTAMGIPTGTCPYVTSSGKAICDKSKSYILLANYDDKSLLRDWSASWLANAIPVDPSYSSEGYLASAAGSPTPSGTSTLMPWAPHSMFVELYINGVYEGNYQLIEDITVDSHRVNITEIDDTTVTDYTGGYLLEFDQESGLTDWNWTTPAGLIIEMEDPEYDVSTTTANSESPQQTAYISNYVNSAETALYGSIFTDVTSGWRAYFDEASAINFYIVNDLMGNADGGQFSASDYLYKDVDNPLLYMGPVWDFDIAAGNVGTENIIDPTILFMQNEWWYSRFFADPGFKADVATQWNALKNNGVLSSWISAIAAEAATLQQSQANNFSRWPMLGIEVWPNAEAYGTFASEVTYMTNYLQLRTDYLDGQFNSKTATTTTLDAPTVTLLNGTNATLTAHVTGGNGSFPGAIYFLDKNNDTGGFMIIGAAAVSGGTASLTTNVLPAGSAQLEAVYGGDTVNALSTSSQLSATVASPLIATATSVGSSALQISRGASVTLSASVIPSSGTASPTGTITFSSNGVTIGKATLSGGVALLATSALTSTAPAQAVYAGDTTFQGSSSPAATVTVTN